MNSKPIRLYAVLAIAGCFMLSIVLPARRILAQSGTWEMKAPMSIPVNGHAVGVINGVLYSVGGGGCGDPVGSPRAPTQAYDPPTDTWTTKTRMPTPRKNMAGTALNGLIYAIGGDNDSSNFATVEAYNPATDTWTTKAPMPTPRNFHAVAVAQGILYAVGGNNGAFLSTVDAYDPATNTWTTKAPMPTPRLGLEVGVVNGIIYAIGGRNNNGGMDINLGTVEAYDPATNTWTSKAPMPTPRERFGVGVVNGIIYAIGGTTHNSSPFFLTVEAYDPASDTWTTKAPLLLAAAPAADVFNGSVYAVGGGGTCSTLGTVEAFTDNRPKVQTVAYIPNQNSNTVSVIDTGTNTVVATIPVAPPEGVAITPNGAFAYVTNYSADTVSVIDTGTNRVVATIPVGAEPLFLAITPDGAHAYVGNAGSPATVSVIDTTANTVVATIPVGPSPYHVAITPDGSRAYVANYLADFVSVIDTSTNAVVTTISVGTGARPSGIAITPDGARAYVTNNAAGTVAVIDAGSNTLVAAIPVGNCPAVVAITPDGARAYVTSGCQSGSDSVTVIDTATNTVVATVAVGSFPYGIAITPDGSRAYVTRQFTQTVSVIDTATNTVVGSPIPGVGSGSFDVAIGTLGGSPTIRNNPPVALCKNVTLKAGPSCTASASIDNGSSDPDSGDTITLSQSPPGPYPLGNTSVTLTVTDNHGASSQCTATVTVVDSTPPTINSVPADASYQCAGQVPPADPSQATASDNCGTPTVAVSQSNNGGAGSPGSPLVITRTFTATDAAGNSASASQTITVIDNTPPTIACPANITVTADLAGGSVVVAYALPTSTDNCSGTAVACSPPSGSSFPVGTTVVTCRATDASSNAASCTFTVTALSPQQAAQSLANSVNSLVSQGVLNQGQGNSLTSKIQAAINQMNNGNGNAARNQLQAFINQVNALLNSGRLFSSQAQALIDAANNVIAHIP